MLTVSFDVWLMLYNLVLGFLPGMPVISFILHHVLVVIFQLALTGGRYTIVLEDVPTVAAEEPPAVDGLFPFRVSLFCYRF